jgi:hypothetical protein
VFRPTGGLRHKINTNEENLKKVTFLTLKTPFPQETRLSSHMRINLGKSESNSSLSSTEETPSPPGSLCTVMDLRESEEKRKIIEYIVDNVNLGLRLINKAKQ